MPIVCDLSAIPAEQRDSHRLLARSLLFGDDGAPVSVPDGLAFHVPAGRFSEAVRFIENERRCCRHLAFSLQVPPEGADLVLTVTGPGAREELEALVH